MISAHATHPGRVRKNNEDCVRTDDTLGIYLLADGIGGHNAGEVASALAIETAYAVMRSNIAHTTVDGFFELLIYAMQTAHWEIQSKALTDLSCTKMGTTLVAAVVRENKAYIAHSGDSRCYLFHPEPQPSCDSSGTGERSTLHPLTYDHTLGAQQLANGVSIDQIPKKQFHTLIQSVGCGDPPYPDFKIVPFKPGDLLLLCSDGLTDMLTDAEIQAILAHQDSSLESRAAELIDAANANGGRDNISVILALQTVPA